MDGKNNGTAIAVGILLLVALIAGLAIWYSAEQAEDDGRCFARATLAQEDPDLVCD